MHITMRMIFTIKRMYQSLSIFIIFHYTSAFHSCNHSVVSNSQPFKTLNAITASVRLPIHPKNRFRFERYTTELNSALSSPEEGLCAPQVKYYFATCIPGLANILSSELIQIGAKNVETSGNSGVYFSSDADKTSNVDIGLKALLWVRSAHRIMEMITSTVSEENFDYYEENPILTKENLYSFIQTAPVQRILGNGRGGLLTLSVNVISNGNLPRELCHSHYTALTVKNALVDKTREMRSDGLRPDVDLTDPDVPLVAVMRGNCGEYSHTGDDNRNNNGRKYFRSKGVEVTLYRMLHSVGSLHRRGYRASGKIHKASMKESLAAGLLLESGWNKLVASAKEDGLPAVFVDPMAGSATLTLEAALIASDFAPGLMRIQCYDNRMRENHSEKIKQWNPHLIPPVVRWKEGDQEQWKELLVECRKRANEGCNWMKRSNTQYPERKNCMILANELHSNAFALASSNIENAGMEDFISLHEGDCKSWDLGGGNEGLTSRAVIPGRTIIGTNPPWGVRLTEDIEASWNCLNLFLRRECNSAEAWVLSGNKVVTRVLHMKTSRKIAIKTADEDLRWLQYHIFQKKDINVAKNQE